jgi:hypothetical protein
MAFPTSHSQSNGTGNPAQTWLRKLAAVRKEIESMANRSVTRDRVQNVPTGVLTAQE